MCRYPPRILVADSDVAARKALTWHLQDAGYYVVPAASAADVLLQCEVEPPEVIIMDVRLPDMDGYDACVQLRHDVCCSDVTIILTTDIVDAITRGYVAKMVDYVGGDYFVAKPYDVNLLVKLVDDAVRTSEKDDTRRVLASPTHVVWPTTQPRYTLFPC